MSPQEHQKFTHYAPYAVMVMIALVGGVFFTVLSVQHNQDVRSRASYIPGNYSGTLSSSGNTVNGSVSGDVIGSNNVIQGDIAGCLKGDNNVVGGRVYGTVSGTNNVVANGIANGPCKSTSLASYPTPTPNYYSSGTSTMTLKPVADATVYSHSASYNHGSKSTLESEYDPYDGGIDYAYLKFDLRSYAGKSVSGAKLRLRTGSSSDDSSSGTQYVKWVSDTSWSESGITYNNRPTISSTSLGSVTPSSINTTYEISLTASQIQSAIGGYFSIALTSSSDNQATFNSKEAYSYAPELVLTLSGGSTYYPTPTPTRSYYPTPTPTRSYYPTPTPTRSYYPTPTPTRAYYPTPTPTKYPTPTPTKYPTPTPTKYPTPTPTKYPTPTPTGYYPTPTPTKYLTPTPSPTPYAYATPTPTAALYPTNTPAPTIPYDQGTTAITFNLALHGLGKGGDAANPNGTGTLAPLHPQRSVNVEVYDASNSLVQTVTGQVTLDSSDGLFKGVVALGNTINSGAYTVKVKTNQFLRTLVPGIQTITKGQNLNLAKTAMVGGDINNDNQLNILDYNVLMGCYSDLSPAVNCAAGDEIAADITDDGAVNMFDYNLFLRELINRGGN